MKDEGATEKPTKPATPRAVEEERRRYARCTLEVGMGVYSDSNFYAGFSRDVSEGGIFVATYDLLPIGTSVEVEFSLPGGHDIRCGGEVRWVKDPVDNERVKPGMGIQFTDLAEEALEAIKEFVASREPIFHV